MLLDYGYRSKCCYAPIRLGRKKLKSKITVQIWICCKCGARDVPLVQYSNEEPSKSTRVPFASEDSADVDDD